jgi:predicted RNA binding protein YcfA (HicA-like mRNA interferase family)
MGRLAGFRYREIIRRLKALGFVFDRQAAGSHEIWYKGLGKNKSSRLACLFGHLLRHGKSFIALLCASFHSSNMTENPAQYGTIYFCRGPNEQSDKYSTIPNHSGDMPEGTLRAILKQANITPEDFLEKA